MNETITLSSSALITIFDLFGYPSDETSGHHTRPWGPFGPGGPVISGPIERKGPRPEPWRFAVLARNAVQRVVTLHDLGNVTGAANATAATAKLVNDMGDWICENDLPQFFLHIEQLFPPGWPNPEPHPFPPYKHQLDPTETIAFGTQFLQAAKVLQGSTLAGPFAESGERIVKIGIEALEKSVALPT